MKNSINGNSKILIGNGGGTCKTIEDVKKMCQVSSLAAIEIGSILPEIREGNSGNTFHYGGNFTLNSLGLPNPGKQYYEDTLAEMLLLIKKAGKISIVNVVGFSPEEYADMARLAFDKGAIYVVANLGCPNVWIDGKQKGILTYDLEAFNKISREIIYRNKIEAQQGRIGVKLSPILDPLHIKVIADELNYLLFENLSGHIGFITTMNTIPNCYYEDSNTSVISPGGGLSGMAGSAVLPLALGQVKQFRALLHNTIKIIGIGGVATGEDVQRMFRAGADLVQITSAYYKNHDHGEYERIGAEYATLTGIEI